MKERLAPDALSSWFLTRPERGNDVSGLDRRHPDGDAWTVGNRVDVLVHGREYFPRLYSVLRQLGADDWVHFTDWEGDADERLAGASTELGNVLCDLARRGVHVRGLLWRSHPRQAHFSEQDNAALTKAVNEAGGEILLDERIRRGGSHHQKLFLVRLAAGPDGDVAFVGGIDLCHGRNDDAEHLGDEQSIDITEAYGDRPPWHDVQLEVHGPAIGDLAWTFRERWSDATPLDHRNPIRAVLRRATRQPRHPEPLPDPRDDPAPCGPHAVQVLRTYPSKRPPYPFAPRGERSIARAYFKAFQRARRLIYFEDQYFWSSHAADALATALRAHPDLRILAVVPRYPDQDGRVSGPASKIGREHATRLLEEAGGDRVLVCDLENRVGTPIYVHAKVCIIDDAWMMVGSDNLNRRSWTHDSELSCAVLDDTRDERAPLDPAGLGDGARVLPRNTRLRLSREHLGRETDEDDLLDPHQCFEAFRKTAEALDAWHGGGERGVRPPGHVRIHTPERVPPHQAVWARPMHRNMVDPDGRPRTLRQRDSF